ncbi:MAG: WYL domain-containing protein [Muribaculaceae bacterium]|nr:WYL domain-containing protein [Muribaculaceae bacterium]
MARNLIEKYIWIIDTLSQYRRLSKEELHTLWRRSDISGGEPLPDRTFYHYRRSIEEIFKIEIKCDNSGRYYIDTPSSMRSHSLTNWLLDSMAVSSALNQNQPGFERIEIEDVPSAREFLPIVLEAIRDSVKLCFTYASFARARAETKIIFHPYFLKRYKQRWYMIGFQEKRKSIRTYALDRIREMQLVKEEFEKPGSITLDQLFGNIVGVTTSEASVKSVKLKTTPTQAKYFRALPLHTSQKEEVHDDYSIFSYQLKLNYELAHEILSFGDSVKVIEPPELKAMVVTQLQETLAQYQTDKK